ncbi:FHA domain-containing protein [bacterium]|nr:MAG: FHA domain-containing protein [bacterium]RIK64115.1 MAG: hypothetical protein DCC64_05230 [Planctomycetota bacterium]
MFRLVFQKSDLAPRAIGAAVIIGRKAPADVLVADATVSASHCRLSPRDEESWTLEDLKSTSGTFLNGRRVSQAVVHPGDVITVGKQNIVLELTGGPTATELMLGVATMYNAAPVTEEEPQAALVLVSGSHPERVTTLKKDVTTIGRGADNAIVLRDDTKASSSHAIISRAGSKWFITDAGSINGTKVNGQRITGETALAHGYQVAVGEQVFQFVIKGAEASEKTVPSSTQELPQLPDGEQRSDNAGLFASHEDWRQTDPAPAGGSGRLVLVLIVLVLALVGVAGLLWMSGVLRF